jgi:5-methylcytosine-specific restriction endonuclease McrA
MSTKPITRKVRKIIADRSEGYCERTFPEGWRCWQPASEIHHLLPTARGGQGEAENLIHLCPACHRWIHDHPTSAESQRLLLRKEARP